MLRCVAIAGVATFVWCFALFWMRQPTLDYFCVCALIPYLLGFLWFGLAWQLLSLIRRHPQPYRRQLIAVIFLAFFLAPYTLIRAGNDMFTLSVRYHLWRAGGADKVRAAFNQWVAIQPVFDPSNGRKFIFARDTPSGNVVPLPAPQLPPEVRYMSERFPCRFGMTWKDVAYIDNVSALTTTDIIIGPPGWQPQGGETLWSEIIGTRRKLDDGIWVQFGVYAK